MSKSIVTYFKKLSFSNLPKTKNPKIISFLFLWKAEKKFLWKAEKKLSLIKKNFLDNDDHDHRNVEIRINC